MKKESKSLPKPRSKLHVILSMKATSNATGKHSKSKKKARKESIDSDGAHWGLVSI